jgi:alpha-galactosidase
MYASWGIDYLKYDWCSTDSLKAAGAYMTMRDALAKAGRPIVLSICEWGTDKPWTWGPSTGHLWRTTGDITACFDCIKEMGGWRAWGVLQILDKQDGLRQYAGPGHWNDPDMLEVGNGLAPNEDRAHFSMWSMLAAPLIAGNDLRSMPVSVAQVLTNREVIAVNQDSLGVQAFRYASRDSVEIWFKPLVGGDWAVTFLNRSATPRSVSFGWAQETVADTLSKRDAQFASTRYQLRNLWTKQAAGTTARPLAATVPAKDVLMLRLHRA